MGGPSLTGEGPSLHSAAAAVGWAHVPLLPRLCLTPPGGAVGPRGAPHVAHHLHVGGGGDEGLAHGAPAHLPVPLPSLRDCVPRSAPAAPALPPRGTDLCPELANTREPRFTTQDAWY